MQTLPGDLTSSNSPSFNSWIQHTFPETLTCTKPCEGGTDETDQTLPRTDGSVMHGERGACITVLLAKQPGVCAHEAVGVWGTEEERIHPFGWVQFRKSPWWTPGLKKKNKPEDPVFSSPFHSCATTSKSLHLSQPPFPHLERDKRTVVLLYLLYVLRLPVDA